MQRILTAFVVLLVVLVSAVAGAATLYVGQGQAHSTIQSAVNAASDGDIIKVAAGVYTENILIESKSLVIQGGWNADFTERDWETYVTVIDGNQSARCLRWANSESGELSGFIISNGRATDYGGGMYNSYSSLTIAYCTFIGNWAKYGGGLCNEQGSTTVTNCTFSGNSAHYGGGLYNVRGSLTMTHCTFSGNTASTSGGGMTNGYCSALIANCTFSGNGSDSYGGGISNTALSTLTVINCTFTGNWAGNAGGGMLSGNLNSFIANSTFSGNDAYQAGGILTQGNPTITNCTFTGNTASTSGGGISNSTNSPTIITNCTFTGNLAEEDGGGIYNSSGSSPTIASCTFSGNTAGNAGGGMCNRGYTVSARDSIFWDNNARLGSQIYNATFAIITYSNIQSGWIGEGNIDANPLFADPENGDFHLKSPFGRWDPAIEDWVYDDMFSPSIAAGDPTSDYDNEPEANGGQINMGAHGNTQYASKYGERAHLTLTVDSTPISGFVILGYRGGTTDYITACKEYDRITLVSEMVTYVAGTHYILERWLIDGAEREAITNANHSSIEFTMLQDVQVTVEYVEVINGPIWYVRAGETGGDGSIGAPFGSIQKAVDSATDYQTVIKVTAGTYVENITVNEKMLHLQGGWNIDFTQRDWDKYVTVIDGNQSGSCIRWIDSKGGGMSGFVITNGVATGIGQFRYGGGMYMENSSPIVANCTFSSNSAQWGGGMYMENSSPIIANCTFSDNSAGRGGGTYNGNSYLNITNCSFTSNSATGSGGGMYNRYDSSTVTNCAFSGNSAYSGGAMFNFGSTGTIRNCTFSGNSAGFSGAMYINSGNTSVRNSIFWNNDGRAGISRYYTATLTITYSNIQAGYTGEGNIDANPLFADPENGDFHLKSPFGRWDPAIEDWVIDTVYSPCIDAGDPASDYSNEPEPNGGRINMGAFGNTPLASKSYIPRTLTVESLPEINVPITGKFPDDTPYSETVAQGRLVTLTAPPLHATTQGVRYNFVQWSLNDSPVTDVDGTIEFTMDDDVTAVAVYVSNIIFVDASATGANDGTSWENAFNDLQDALAIAAAGREIWVASGTYKPTSGTDRNISFVMKEGVGMYGGFAGDEDPATFYLGDRNFTMNETILSGDLLGNDNENIKHDEPTRVDNSYTVIVGANNAILDGFTITGGNANATSGDMHSPQRSGGGMHNRSSRLAIAGCIFSYNTAQSSGGGMFNSSSSLTITDSTFSYNSARSAGGMHNRRSSLTITDSTFSYNAAQLYGGGMLNESHSSPTITNCTLSRNSAGTGGGMSNWDESSPTITDSTLSYNSAEWGGGMSNWHNSSPTITDSIFSYNSAAERGGGMSNSGNSPTITECTFSENSAVWGGGMSNDWQSSPTITNCTFSGNLADYGNTIACGSYQQQNPSTVTILNSIIWDGEDWLLNNDDSEITITYSNVQGGWAGIGNIDADPLFADPSNRDFRLKSRGGRWNPATEEWVIDTVHSPCIDAGDPASDYSIEPEPNGGRINMGAYGNTATASKSYIAPVNIQSIPVEAVAVTGTHPGVTNYAVSLPTQSDVSLAVPDTLIFDGLRYNFIRWLINEQERAAGQTSVQFTINHDTTAIAVYEPIPYTGPTWYVSSGSVGDGSVHYPFGTIQEAVDAASSSQSINVAEGTYAEHIVIDGKALNLLGGWSADFTERDHEEFVTAINGSNEGRCIRWANAESSELSGFTIRNGASGTGSGMFNHNVIILIEHCTFVDNASTQDGGAIASYNCDLMISNCTFTGNSSRMFGGAIYNYGSNFAINDCTLTDNSSRSDGGGMGNFSSSGSIVNCTFNGNSGRFGGGMYNYFDSKYVSIINCNFIGNTAGQGGALVSIDLKSPIIGSTFIGNSASEYAGALCLEYGSPEISASTFSNNSAGRGGAVYNEFGNPIFTNTVFNGNSATVNGGTVHNEYGGLTIISCTLNGNNAKHGASIVCNSYGQKYVIIKNSILRDGDEWLSNVDGCTIEITYSNIQGGWPGEGNIDVDPRFADPSNGDFRLKSRTGRWDPAIEDWVIDSVHSLGIDAGDPASDYSNEPEPNGGRINMGAYGNTATTSKSWIPTLTVQSVPLEAVLITGTHPGLTNYTMNPVQKSEVLLAAPGVLIVDNLRYNFTHWLINEEKHSVTTVQFSIEEDIAAIAVYNPIPYTGPTWYVKSAYAGDGSFHYPFGTIQQAVDAASSGHTIKVAEGVYAENIVVDDKSLFLHGSWDINFTQRAWGIHSSVIDGKQSGTCVTWLNAAGDFSGFTMTGGLGSLGGGIRISNSNLIITDCNFIMNNAAGGGAIYASDSNVSVTSSLLDSNVANWYGGGIYSYKSIFALANSILSRNTTEGLGGGLYSSDSEVTANNCTIASNYARWSGGGMYSSHSIPNIYNSIVWDNNASSEAQVGDWDSVSIIEYSCVQGGWTGEGNIDSDPLFADPENGNYHLKSQYGRWNFSANDGKGGWVLDDLTSPAIAAGDPASDNSREPQPNGEAVNMGAYGNTEYASKAGTWWQIPGDATRDCSVSIADLVFIRKRLNSDRNISDNWRADVNDDGVIDVLDLIYVRNRLGTACPPEGCPPVGYPDVITSREIIGLVLFAPTGVELEEPYDVFNVYFNGMLMKDNVRVSGTLGISELLPLVPGQNDLRFEVVSGGADRCGRLQVRLAPDWSSQTISLPQGESVTTIITYDP